MPEKMLESPNKIGLKNIILVRSIAVSLFSPEKLSIQEEKNKEYDKLAEVVKNNLRMKKIYQILEIK